jgi:hypothetical protein
MSENNNSIGMNELVDYKKKEYGKFRGAIMHFLWKCAGSDSQILKYAPFSDHIKAAGIGGVVLATTVMATVAMGFAMHTIFGENTKHGHTGNWLVTIPAALVWGLIIFNLDRFIVSTVKGDGTEKITGAEWGAMLPRLVMAIIIGLTISAPLETHIFEKEINREWTRVQNKLSQNRQNELELKYAKENNNLDSLAMVGQKDLDSADARFKRNEQIAQWIGSGLFGWGPCDGGASCPNKAHADVFLARDAARIDKINVQKILAQVKADKQKLVDKIRIEKDKEGGKIENSTPGFLDQLMMLENLSDHGENFTPVDTEGKPVLDEDGNEKVEELYGAAGGPIWLVRLLFMIVEIAPVIFKFMIWDSSYDYMKDNVAQILEAKQGISLESFPDENNNTHRIRRNYNAERIVEVSKRQNDLEKENAIHAITLYAEQERKEIEDNPEDFVQNKDHDANNGK